MTEQLSYTGIDRQRKTSRRVRIADATARTMITVGGIGTIVAVSTVCLFLVWVVLPLFGSAEIGEPSVRLVPSKSKRLLHVGVDEYRVVGWTLDDRANLTVFRVDGGEVLEQRSLADGAEVTATSWVAETGSLALGLGDGTLRTGSIKFETTFIRAEDEPEAFSQLAPGEAARHENGVVERTSEGQLRWQRVVAELLEPVASGSDAAITHISFNDAGAASTFAALTADGRLFVKRIVEREDMMTLEITHEAEGSELPFEPYGDREPSRLLLLGRGDVVVVAWDSGRCVRYDTRDLEDGHVAEVVDLVPAPERTLTCLSLLLGRTTLLAGDSAGDVGVWFTTKPEHAATPDGATLVRVRTLEGTGSPVRALASSKRMRAAVVAYDDARLRVFQVTNDELLASSTLPDGAVDCLAVAPKDDGIIGAHGTGITWWDFDPAYAEATLSSLFLPVWYEGYDEPEHVWQSSSGTDDSEPKLGLIPLIFGTIKATFYSLLFGVPLALLAAIYTSEFLQPKVKSRVKPTVELMASLPSVVLGFFAALIVAPFIEHRVPEALACFVTIPLVFLAGAHVWQALPPRITLKMTGLRFLFICACLPLGLWLGALCGPLIERVFFAGDIVLWLDGQIGSGTGAWMFLMLPLAALATLLLTTRLVTPWLREIELGVSRPRAALLEAAKLAAACVFTLAIAWGVSAAISAAGWDPRGSFVSTYVQRNALVVGFIMGFAIIPIIYTIAEDALSTVPEHLRAASLGAGATPWQTAVRIVIPTAMSGLFSAVMIGLGRAVGETMIVLMAAGNTPVLDWNIFNGFRTLSANIAVELPEAVRDSTHYRTLFLAALVLFVMTFILNTFAEIVRQRFRRRAYQL